MSIYDPPADPHGPFDDEDDSMQLRKILRTALAQAFADRLSWHGIPDTIPADCVPEWTAQLGDDDPREYRHGPVKLHGQFTDRHDPEHVEIALTDLAKILETNVQRETIGGQVQGAIRTEIEGIEISIWGTVAHQVDQAVDHLTPAPFQGG